MRFHRRESPECRQATKIAEANLTHHRRSSPVALKQGESAHKDNKNACQMMIYFRPGNVRRAGWTGRFWFGYAGDGLRGGQLGIRWTMETRPTRCEASRDFRQTRALRAAGLSGPTPTRERRRKTA